MSLVYMCRRCWSKQWRGHPADHYHHPHWRSYWDLQNDWQRGPAIDFTLLLWHPSITYCSIHPLPWIFNQIGFSLYIAWSWNGINSPPCMSLAVPQLLPSCEHEKPSAVWPVTCHTFPKLPIVSLNAEYYQHFYQSFSFHWFFFFLTFHTLCNLCCVCECCTTLLTHSQVLKSCFIKRFKCKENFLVVRSHILQQLLQMFQVKS